MIVKVPEFVHDWIKHCKDNGASLGAALGGYYWEGNKLMEINTPNEVILDEWYRVNQENFARAWLDGYEVLGKEDKVHVVKLNNLYFINWGEDGCHPVFNVDGVGAINEAYHYDNIGDAIKTASIFGGVVESFTPKRHDIQVFPDE